ncbi:MAG: NAD(P)H-binding protein [Bacteroidales bacterium]
MKSLKATLIGSSGLIGSNLLEILKSDDDFSELKIIVRRPLKTNHPKVTEEVIDFADNKAFKESIAGSDVVFCAVGTTNKKVKGDKAEYRKVDYDIPVNAAKFCKEAGCPKFIFVSSVGANSQSKNFYLKLKGEVEDAVKSLEINTAISVRPSLLLGKRKEYRFGEFIGKYLIVPLSVFFPSQMKPIKAVTVAKAMQIASKKEFVGFKVFHRKEMKELIN